MDKFFLFNNVFISDPERLLIAALAMVLVLVLGAVLSALRFSNFHPLLWQLNMAVLGRLGEKLDRVNRRPADLAFRAVLMIVFSIGLTAAVFFILSFVLSALNVYRVADLLFLMMALSGGGLWVAIIRLYKSMKSNEKFKGGSYYPIANASRIDLKSVDKYGITRVTMTLFARFLDKTLVAPIFWYVILGNLGLVVYSALSCLAWKYGKNGFGSVFGLAMVRLECLLGIIPSMIASCIILFASLFTPTASLLRAVQGGVSKQGQTPYAQGWFPVKVWAYVLNISIGGAAKSLEGQVMKSAWVGPSRATAQISYQHLKRALYLYTVSYLIILVMLMALYTLFFVV